MLVVFDELTNKQYFLTNGGMPGRADAHLSWLTTEVYKRYKDLIALYSQAMWEQLAGQVIHRHQLIIC